jgi:cytochrome c oxidase subunit 2
MADRRRRAVIAVGFVCSLVLGACGSDTDGGATPEQRGQKLAERNGCQACHGLTWQGGTGPAFVGAYGRQVELTRGPPVTADEKYLYDAIRQPHSQIVKGYPENMPLSKLSDSQINDIVAFIKSLSPSSTVRTTD